MEEKNKKVHILESKLPYVCMCEEFFVCDYRESVIAFENPPRMKPLCACRRHGRPFLFRVWVLALAKALASRYAVTVTALAVCDKKEGVVSGYCPRSSPTLSTPTKQESELRGLAFPTPPGPCAFKLCFSAACRSSPTCTARIRAVRHIHLSAATTTTHTTPQTTGLASCMPAAWPGLPAVCLFALARSSPPAPLSTPHSVHIYAHPCHLKELASLAPPWHSPIHDCPGVHVPPTQATRRRSWATTMYYGSGDSNRHNC